jgi:hypothetical protein
MTTEKLVGLAEELGDEIPKGLKHKGKEKIALYVDKQLAEGEASMWSKKSEHISNTQK